MDYPGEMKRTMDRSAWDRFTSDGKFAVTHCWYRGQKIPIGSATGAEPRPSFTKEEADAAYAKYVEDSKK